MSCTFSEVAEDIVRAQAQIQSLQPTGSPIQDARNAMRVATTTIDTVRTIVRKAREGKISDQGALFAIEELLGI